MRNVFFPLSTLVFFSLLAFGGVFSHFFYTLPRFRIEVWLINLYIRRQGWSLVRLRVSQVSIFGAKFYLYFALMGRGARYWVGEWVGEISNFFHLLHFICLEGGICRYPMDCNTIRTAQRANFSTLQLYENKV